MLLAIATLHKRKLLFNKLFPRIMDIDEICNLKEDVTNPRLSTSLGVHGFGSCLYVGIRIPGRIVSTFSGLHQLWSIDLQSSLPLLLHGGLRAS